MEAVSNQRKLRPISQKNSEESYSIQQIINDIYFQSMESQRRLRPIAEKSAQTESNQRTVKENCVWSAKKQGQLCPFGEKSMKTMSNQRKTKEHMYPINEKIATPPWSANNQKKTVSNHQHVGEGCPINKKQWKTACNQQHISENSVQSAKKMRKQYPISDSTQ